MGLRRVPPGPLFLIELVAKRLTCGQKGRGMTVLAPSSPFCYKIGQKNQGDSSLVPHPAELGPIARIGSRNCCCTTLIGPMSSFRAQIWAVFHWRRPFRHRSHQTRPKNKRTVHREGRGRWRAGGRRRRRRRLRRRIYSLEYGLPSAAGGRTRPTRPETTAIVIRYGAIDRNGAGIPTLSTPSTLWRDSAKPKRSAAPRAP